MNAIPKLIPIPEKTSEATLDNIKVGNILTGEMILSGQRTSTGTQHSIEIIHLGNDNFFIGNHGGLVFEMEKVGVNTFALHRTDTQTSHGEHISHYYGTLIVDSIKRGIPIIRKNGGLIKDSIDFDCKSISLPENDDTKSDITGTHAVIDTTRTDVSGVVGFDSYHPSKEIHDLSYLGDLYPGIKISGILERPKAYSFEDIVYTIKRITGSKILLTRTVYNKRTQETKVKEYILRDIIPINATNFIGVITSSTGDIKGDFQFSTERYQKSEPPKGTLVTRIFNGVKKKIKIV